MKTLILIFLCILILAQPVSALEIEAPDVPKSGMELMPEASGGFSQGLWEMLKRAVSAIQPDVQEAASVCLLALVMVLICAMIQSFPGNTKDTADLVTTVAIGTLLLKCTHALIGLGAQTVTEMSEYGKLLLPVMTAGLAAQGGVTASAALYTGTALFNSILSGLISGILIPMVYLQLALGCAQAAIGNDALKKILDFIKWLTVWCLKIILYAFTGYMSITGVVSGTADASALKAAKLTISGVVPVVGGILSDASEAVLVGANLAKNAAGIYGMLAVLAVCITPFFRIGVHYLLLKLTAALSGVIASKRASKLLEDFSSAMGLVLAMTGSVCLLLLISTVCFLKGVGS